jgi:hypothetical protein
MVKNIPKKIQRKNPRKFIIIVLLNFESSRKKFFDVSGIALPFTVA